MTARMSLGDFKPMTHAHVNTHRKVQASLHLQDRIALAITGAIGTMYAVYGFAMFMAAWMLFQVSSGHSAFDPREAPGPGAPPPSQVTFASWSTLLGD